MAIENLKKDLFFLEVLFSNFVLFGYIEAGQPKRKKKRTVDEIGRVCALVTWYFCFSVARGFVLHLWVGR